MPRRLRCIPRVESVAFCDDEQGTAFFNGPGFVLCFGREVRIELDGRNWGVKNAGLLPLGSGLNAGISWNGGMPPSKVLSITFESASQTAERNKNGQLTLPAPVSAPHLQNKDFIDAYPPRNQSRWEYYARVLSHHIQLIHSHETGAESEILFADTADLAAFELAWCFSYDKEHTDRTGTGAEVSEEFGDKAILSIKEHILLNREAEIDYQRLASERGISFTTFRRRWTRIVGQSPGEFLARARMEKARYLLTATSKSIGDIAKESGYKDQLYFSRRFHHYHGVSPREFRNEGS